MIQKDSGSHNEMAVSPVTVCAYKLLILIRKESGSYNKWIVVSPVSVRSNKLLILIQKESSRITKGQLGVRSDTGPSVILRYFWPE